MEARLQRRRNRRLFLSCAVAENAANEKELKAARTLEHERPSQGDGIHADSDSGLSSGDLKGVAPKTSSRVAVVHGLNRPLFHIDLTSALQSAIANVQARDDFEGRGGPGIGEVP
jgi:solute carrier family 26 (sodium-independent sulfate anion transporter), member 11